MSGSTERVDYSFGFAGLDSNGFSAFGHRIPRLYGFAPPGGFDRDGARRAGATGRVGVQLADEIHATGIQTLAILAKSVGKRTPDILEEGLADARRLLRERGLLDPEQDRP